MFEGKNNYFNLFLVKYNLCYILKCPFFCFVCLKYSIKLTEMIKQYILVYFLWIMKALEIGVSGRMCISKSLVAHVAQCSKKSVRTRRRKYNIYSSYSHIEHLVTVLLNAFDSNSPCKPD